MIMECHYTCSDSGDHKGLKQDNNDRTCQCVSVSVGGRNPTDSVNGGIVPLQLSKMIPPSLAASMMSFWSQGEK